MARLAWLRRWGLIRPILGRSITSGGKPGITPRSVRPMLELLEDRLPPGDMFVNFGPSNVLGIDPFAVNPAPQAPPPPAAPVEDVAPEDPQVPPEVIDPVVPDAGAIAPIRDIRVDSRRGPTLL